MQRKLNIFHDGFPSNVKNKTLMFFTLMSCILFFRLLIISFIEYRDLQKVSGKVSQFDSVYYISERVTIKLDHNDNLYYQQYYKRFQDDKVVDISNGNEITFYTTSYMHTRVKSIFASKEFKQFNYYPIFNINENKCFADVFLYQFYRGTFLNILTNIIFIGMLFYSIPSVAVAGWFKRGVILIIAAFFLWMYY